MKKNRSILCALLVTAMVSAFGACDKTSDDQVLNEYTVPAVTEESTAPSEEMSVEPSVAASTRTSSYQDRSDLVILNWDEYLNRPHGIQPGTVLNYLAPDDVPLHFPWNCSYAGWLWGNVYEGLLYMYMNDPEDIRGCIAESWTHSDDYLTWTFQIRDGVTFTDGTNCDAYAIAKAWDYIYEKAPHSFSNCNIVSWEAAGANELVVRLSAPCPWFEVGLCGNGLLVVSPTALELYGMDDNKAAIGTGPYFIESYTSGKGYVFKANPEYDLYEKTPCIETVNFRIVGNMGTVLARNPEHILDQLQSGELDGANFNTMGKDNIFSLLQARGYDGNLVATYGGVNPIWLNPKTVPVFQTFEVRKALCRFIDFNNINNLFYNGTGRVQDSFWAKGTSGYVPTDQFYYNPEEGNALLSSVGLQASDIVFESHIMDSDKDMYLAIQSELTRSGVQWSFEVYGPEYSFMRTMNGQWHIIYYGNLGYSNFAPYAPWTFILKPDALIRMCFQDVYNPELYQTMLDAYDAMITAPTWDEMLAHCNQLTAYVQDDFGAVGGVQSPAFLALGNNFKNGVYFSEQHDIQLYYLYQ